MNYSIPCTRGRIYLTESNRLLSTLVTHSSGHKEEDMVLLGAEGLFRVSCPLFSQAFLRDEEGSALTSTGQILKCWGFFSYCSYTKKKSKASPCPKSQSRDIDQFYCLFNSVKGPGGTAGIWSHCSRCYSNCFVQSCDCLS